MANSLTLLAPLDRERIESAHRFIDGGRLDEAETLVADVLRDAPGHVDALFTFAAVALARKLPDKAVEILNPLATAYPDDARIISSLGLAHRMAGRIEEAMVCLERAVALAPADDAALRSLGMIRFLANDIDGAREAAKKLAARLPDDAATLSLLGVVAMASRAHADAEHYLSRAVQIDPHNEEGLRHLSVFYLQRQRYPEALTLAERAQIAAPLDINTLEQLARCLAAIGRYQEAEAACRKILAFAPNHVGVREILARVLVVTGSPDAGIGELSRLVKAAPKNLEALLALASTVRFAGRIEQALPFAEHAVKLAPDNERAAALRQEVRLALGRLPEPGERTVELPSALRVVVPPPLRAPEFVFFARFIARLAGVGVVKVEADEQFVSLLECMRIPIELGPQQEAETGIPVPALLDLLPTGAAAAGNDVPYMAPPPSAKQKWQEALAGYRRPWIGVLWETGALGFSMEQIRDALPEGTYISLVGGNSRHQLRDWPQAIDAGFHQNEFHDLVAAIDCMDIVVGPDVAALHVCGALGKPGVVVVPAGYPWYWAATDGRSLWYPTISVVAQDRVGQWANTMARARDSLRAAIYPC